jgi:hypothetical protein
VLPLLGLAALAGCHDSSPTGSDRVTAPSLESIAITGNVEVEAGGQSQLTVTASYSDGRSQDVTRNATYRSSDDSIATVSSSGLLTGVREGTATVSTSYQEGGITREGSVEARVLREIPEYTLSVDVSAIRILEDCDPGPFIQTGPGEFTYRVMTRFPEDAGDITLAESGNRVSRNRGEIISINRGRQESLRGDTGSVSVSFRLTEWDDNTADSDMNNRLGSRSHTLQNGQWTGTGANSVTIGPSGCKAQLEYRFTAVRTR